jgi:hypothetical protein
MKQLSKFGYVAMVMLLLCIWFFFLVNPAHADSTNTDKGLLYGVKVAVNRWKPQTQLSDIITICDEYGHCTWVYTLK